MSEGGEPEAVSAAAALSSAQTTNADDDSSAASAETNITQNGGVSGKTSSLKTTNETVSNAADNPADVAMSGIRLRKVATRTFPAEFFRARCKIDQTKSLDNTTISENPTDRIEPSARVVSTEIEANNLPSKDDKRSDVASEDNVNPTSPPNAPRRSSVGAKLFARQTAKEASNSFQASNDNTTESPTTHATLQQKQQKQQDGNRTEEALSTAEAAMPPSKNNVSPVECDKNKEKMKSLAAVVLGKRPDHPENAGNAWEGRTRKKRRSLPLASGKKVTSAPTAATKADPSMIAKPGPLDIVVDEWGESESPCLYHPALLIAKEWKHSTDVTEALADSVGTLEESGSRFVRLDETAGCYRAISQERLPMKMAVLQKCVEKILQGESKEHPERPEKRHKKKHHKKKHHKKHKKKSKKKNKKSTKKSKADKPAAVDPKPVVSKPVVAAKPVAKPVKPIKKKQDTGLNLQHQLILRMAHEAPKHQLIAMVARPPEVAGSASEETRNAPKVEGKRAAKSQVKTAKTNNKARKVKASGESVESASAHLLAEAAARGERTSQAQDSLREPHDHDILCGRGNGIASHPGNKMFRNFVRSKKRDYDKTGRNDKWKIAMQVLRMVSELRPKGRFIEKNRENGRWTEVPHEQVMAKTLQALRERKWRASEESPVTIPTKQQQQQQQPQRRAIEQREVAAPSTSPAAASSGGKCCATRGGAKKRANDNNTTTAALLRPITKLTRAEKLERIRQIDVNAKVSIYWPLDGCYYTATVKDKIQNSFFIAYEDDETEEWIDLTEHEFKVLQEQRAATDVAAGATTNAVANNGGGAVPSEGGTSSDDDGSVATPTMAEHGAPAGGIATPNSSQFSSADEDGGADGDALPFGDAPGLTTPGAAASLATTPEVTPGGVAISLAGGHYFD